MAIPLAVNVSKNSTTGTSNTVVTKNTGTVDGDLLYAFLHGDESNATAATFGAPIGWTPETATVKGGTTAGASFRVFSKIASSEGANWTFTRATGGSGAWGVTVVRVTGHDPSNPLNTAVVTNDFDSGDEGTTPAITTTVIDCLILRFSTWNEGKTLTNIPTGTTDITGTGWNDLSSNDGYVVQEAKATAGVSAAKAFNTSSGTQTANVTIAIQPPQGGGEAVIDAPALALSLSAPSVTILTQRQPTQTPSAQTFTLAAPTVNVISQNQQTEAVEAQALSLAAPNVTVLTQLQATPTPASQTYSLVAPAPVIVTHRQPIATPTAQAFTLAMGALTLITQRQPIQTPTAQTYNLSTPGVTILTQIQATVELSALAWSLGALAVNVTSQNQSTAEATALAWLLAAPSVTVLNELEATAEVDALAWLMSAPAVNVVTQRQPTASLSALAWSLAAPQVAVLSSSEQTAVVEALALTLLTVSPSISTQRQPTVDLDALLLTLSTPGATPVNQRQPVATLGVSEWILGVPTVGAETEESTTVSLGSLALTLAAIDVVVVIGARFGRPLFTPRPSLSAGGGSLSQPRSTLAGSRDALFTRRGSLVE